MRLIDADALKEVMWRSAVDTREKIAEIIDNAPTFDCMHCDDFYEIEDCRNCPITNTSTKEMPERPQGKWLDIYKSHIAYECSNCHIQMPITDYYNFCPNCGADMRGDKNNG